MAEHFSLRWNNFHRNMSSGFRTLLMEDSLVDVTLAADGRFVQAHRLVLSVCSPYFKDLFAINPCNHPIVILKDVHFKQLTDILSFMYQGEVNVRQEDLADFLKTAELLQIRGLAEQNVDKESKFAVSSQVATAKHSMLHSPQGSSESKKEPQPRVRVSQLAQTALEQAVPLQEQASASRIPTSTAVGAQELLQPRPATSPRSCQPLLGERSSTSMLLGVSVKQELPDVPSDAEQEVDSYEYLPGGENGDETGINDTPIILHDGDPEGPQVMEKSLWTAPSSQGGARKSPARNLKEDATREGASSGDGGSSIEPPKVSKKMPRKQRIIALNKIRRFLVTPKRSRRIAFARKMKRKKKVILKSGLSADSVTDVSKPLSAMSRNTVGLKNAAEVEWHKQMNEKDVNVPVVSLNEIQMKEYMDVETESKEVLNKKITKGHEMKKVVVSVADANKKKDVPEEKRKIKPLSTEQTKKPVAERKILRKKVTSNVSKDENIATSLENADDKNDVKVNNPIVKNNSSPVNKKKIIVVIAAKKTKSAVALARKIPIRGRDLGARQSSIERGVAGATAHLRSSTPHSNSVKDSGTANGQACRHSGCLGCRGGN